MTDSVEIAITSDASEQLWSSCAWDVHTGTQLMTYRSGGAPAPKTVTIVKDRYLVSSNPAKPLLGVWPINRQEPVSSKYLLPACPNALCVTPDGNYAAVGIAQSFKVYNLGTGVNLCTVSHHYGNIVALKFTDDGSHLVSAAQDCRIAVWSLTRLVQQKDAEALYEFSDFTLPITDLFVGKGGMRAMMGATSLDRSCKLYDLASGQLTLNVVFPVALSALTINSMETTLFVGDQKGQIYVCHLLSLPRSKEVHLSQPMLNESTLSGHKKAITCLSVSIDNETLLSGSEDERVIVWHIPTRQLLRVLPHKGAITNAFFLLTPRLMFDQTVTLPVPFPPIQNMTGKKVEREEMVFECLVTEEPVRPEVERNKDCHWIEMAARMVANAPSTTTKKQQAASSVLSNSDESCIERLSKEVAKLKKINKRMYEKCTSVK
uniref:Putative agap000479-pa-like protein n=1 Tax=Anopheles darlingi TaxID=43151 RepID=A0A2M4CSQ3_ANODA